MVRTPTEDNPLQMYIDLAYNISIIMLLGFALRKMGKYMGRHIGTNNNQTILASTADNQKENQGES